MRPDVYICSKPLQYFNIKNIGPIANESNKKILILHTDFLGAELFAKKIEENDNCWDKVIIVHNKKEYYKYLKKIQINFLFVENDASINLFIFMIRSKIKKSVKSLFVFEEGIGSYRSDLHKGIDKFIRSLIQIGTHYGDSLFTQNIILYEPHMYNEKFHSKKAIPFSINFIDALKKHHCLLSKLCGELSEFNDCRNKRLLIYITNHNINKDIINIMITQKNDYDYLYIKPHPHIKDYKSIPKDIKIINTNIIMEYIINDLIEKNNKLKIWHESSTSLVYFIGKVEEENFSEFPIYDEFINFRKKHIDA